MKFDCATGTIFVGNRPVFRQCYHLGKWVFDPEYLLRANPPEAWISPFHLRQILSQDPIHVREVQACWGSQCNNDWHCCQYQVGVTLEEAKEISCFLLRQGIDPRLAFDLSSDEHLFLARFPHDGRDKWCYFFDCARGECAIHEQSFRSAWCALSFCQLGNWIENITEFLDYVRKEVAHPARVIDFERMLAEISDQSQLSSS